jgi:iron complex outermembrane receptor protein
MKRLSILFTYIILFTNASAQSYELSGKVTDANKHPLPSVLVMLTNTLYTSTDSRGEFTFSGLPAASYEIKLSKEGFQKYNHPVAIKGKNVFITLILHEQSYRLQEVVVTDNHIQTRRKEESLNVEVVNQDFIQRNLGGSLMTTLSRLPGIKTIGIGSGQSKPLIRGLGFNRIVVVDKGVKHEGQQWGADHGLELDQFAAGEVD